MITKQVRPFLVDLTDRVEKCVHGWPIEASECPLCIKILSREAHETKIQGCGCGICRPQFEGQLGTD